MTTRANEGQFEMSTLPSHLIRRANFVSHAVPSASCHRIAKMILEMTSMPPNLGAGNFLIGPRFLPTGVWRNLEGTRMQNNSSPEKCFIRMRVRFEAEGA